MPKALALTLASDSTRPQDRPAAVTLDSFGEVLTDVDLARLLRVSPQWPAQQRFQAKRRGRAPDLPECLRGLRQARYHREAVAAWLRGRGWRGR